MNVIFLDIDGVLNCKRTPNPRKLPYIVDPLLLKRFVQLVDRIGSEVVLSSTWRYDPAGLFSAKHWGIPFIDVLPDMPKRPRRDEILAWLKAHPDTGLSPSLTMKTMSSMSFRYSSPPPPQV
jgi:HAD domain in Swiss Army Knife RNA repair proteins